MSPPLFLTVFSDRPADGFLQTETPNRTYPCPKNGTPELLILGGLREGKVLFQPIIFQYFQLPIRNISH